MTALERTRWTDTADPETLAVAALEAPRCGCGSNLCCEGLCVVCGKEIRVEGTLALEFRRAAYERRLS